MTDPAGTKTPMPPAVPAEKWAPPTADEEFVFEGIDSAPGWVDKGWASYNNGPALAVPAGDVYGAPPYTTKVARLGDTVMFKAATPAKAAHFEVIPGEPVGEQATKKVPQVSNASLEDSLKTGVMSPDDLSDEAKGQVAMRSPHLASMLDGSQTPPEAVPVSDIVKTQ